MQNTNTAQLIPIATQAIAGEERQAVNARELHAFLEVGRRNQPRPRRLEAQALRAKPHPVVKAALRENKPPAWAVLHLV